MSLIIICGFCAAIFLFALKYWVELHSEYKRLSQILVELQKRFPDIGEISFSAQDVILSVENTCRKHTQFNNAWMLYKQQWFPSDISNKVCNSDFASAKDASTFFNPYAIFEISQNWNFYRVLPSLLTGAGILGTFIGLSFGISGISGFSDEAGLFQLLDGASLAFFTSIIGISTSLFFTASLKKYEHQLNSLLEDLSNRMNWIIPVITEQKFNELSLSAIKENSEVSSMLKKAILEFGQTSREQVFELMSVLVNEFTLQLKNEIHNLGPLFEKSLNKNFKELGATLSSLSEALKETRDSSSTLNKELLQIVANYQVLAKKIEDLDTSLGQHIIDYNNIVDEIKSDLTAVSKQFKSISKKQEEMLLSSTQLSEQVSNTVISMDASMKHFDTSIQDAEKMLSLSRDCINHLNNQSIPALMAMETTFQTISEKNQETVLEFRKTSSELTKGSDLLRKNMQSTLKDADFHLAGAIDVLSKAVIDWGHYQKETTKKLADAAKQLKKTN